MLLMCRYGLALCRARACVVVAGFTSELRAYNCMESDRTCLDRTTIEGIELWMLLACWLWCTGRALRSGCHDYCRELELKAVLHRYGQGCAKRIDLLLLSCAYCVCLCHREELYKLDYIRLETTRPIVCYRWASRRLVYTSHS